MVHTNAQQPLLHYGQQLQHQWLLASWTGLHRLGCRNRLFVGSSFDNPPASMDLACASGEHRANVELAPSVEDELEKKTGLASLSRPRVLSGSIGRGLANLKSGASLSCLFLEGNLGFSRTHGFGNDSAGRHAPRGALLGPKCWPTRAGLRGNVASKSQLPGLRGNIHRVCEAAEARKSQ